MPFFFQQILPLFLHPLQSASFSVLEKKKNVLQAYFILAAPAASTAPASTDHMRDIDEAIASIHQHRRTALTLEELYYIVEATCMAGGSAALYARLRQKCSEHLHACLAILLKYPFLHLFIASSFFISSPIFSQFLYLYPSNSTKKCFLNHRRH